MVTYDSVQYNDDVMLVAFEFDGVFYVSNQWEGGLGVW